jgi:MerR family mercuric resistance operon transcriptional regulator
MLDRVFEAPNRDAFFVSRTKNPNLRLTPHLGAGFRLPLENEKGMMQRLTIGRLAELGGVNLETVRYYERRGLLPKPPRTQAGYRQFSPDAAQRLRFIKRAQELGFSLEEIRDLLALRVEPGNCADVRARAQAKIADIEEKMKTLAAMKSTLRNLVNRCEHAASGECVILDSLEDSE